MLALYINKYITDILQKDENITTLVESTNIQPLVLEPTDFPFISFSRVRSTTEYNKGRVFIDEITEDIAEVEFAVVAENYAQSVEIAARLRDCLECRTYINKEDEVRLTSIKLLGTSEDKDKVYIQYLLFEFHLDKID